MHGKPDCDSRLDMVMDSLTFKREAILERLGRKPQFNLCIGCTPTLSLACGQVKVTGKSLPGQCESRRSWRGVLGIVPLYVELRGRNKELLV